MQLTSAFVRMIVSATGIRVKGSLEHALYVFSLPQLSFKNVFVSSNINEKPAKYLILFWYFGSLGSLRNKQERNGTGSWLIFTYNIFPLKKKRSWQHYSLNTYYNKVSQSPKSHYPNTNGPHNSLPLPSLLSLVFLISKHTVIVVS